MLANYDCNFTEKYIPMKKISLIIFISLFHNILFSQGHANIAELQVREDSLKTYAFKIVNGTEAGDRFEADSVFTKMLVRALVQPYSFQYPFDSLQTISRLYAPDSSFRIFTWQVMKDESTFRRKGAIQMKTSDGSLKLFPLIDKTNVLEDINLGVYNSDNWVGAIYYKIIEKAYRGKKFYTLLGYDEHSFRSTKKRIEVLTFDDNGKPVFGGRYFVFEKYPNRNVHTRFDIEYKKFANGSIKFDDEMDMIIFDHLISENNQPDKKFTYIPDGDYEGFKWQNGRWVHIDKVFTFKLEDGQAPVERPLNESKLNIRRD